MVNTYDLLLNPPVKKPQKSEHKKIVPREQETKQRSTPAAKKTFKSAPASPLAPPAGRGEKRTATEITINQPMNRSVNSFIHQSTNRLMNKPTGFYISEQLDNRLDRAVEFFRQNHGLKKVDRSILLNALLESEELWEEAALNQLIDRLIRLLTNRLMG